MNNPAYKKQKLNIGFKSLLLSQFLGALNDNVFKTVVSLLLLRTVVTESGGGGYLSLAHGVFVLPYILFSAYAGFFADRFSKSQIIQYVKILEVTITGLAFYFLVKQNVPALYLVLFLMGLHSTLFSPAKYGIIPEIVEEKDLSRANGYLEFWTFLAIILGTVLATLLTQVGAGSYFVPGSAIFIFALVGFITSLFITRTKAIKGSGKLELNALKDTFKAIGEIKKDKPLFLTLLAIAWFWFLGSIYQLNSLLYAKQIMHFDAAGEGWLLAALALGIGGGSIVCGIVSEGKVELGLVPLGAIGTSFFSILLGSLSGFPLLVFIFMTLAGISAGFFIVPLQAFLQSHSPIESRGRFIAASNAVSFSAMLLASGILWVLTELFGFKPTGVFILMGIASIGVTIYICRTLPEMLIRCLNWIVIHLIYRLSVYGRENVPKTGGGLIVCNHVSYIDASLIVAALERPVRYLMYKPVYESKLINPIARAVKAIPIAGLSGGKSRQQMVESIAEARKQIENGELVCIFAEGAITRVGQLLPFKKGLEFIVKDLDVPVIPVYLDRLWGSIFSFSGGKALAKRPKEFPYRVGMYFGKPLPSSSKAYQVRQVVQELGAEAYTQRKAQYQLLHEALIKTARQNFWQTCCVDTNGKSVSYGKLLATAFCLKKKLGKKLGQTKMLGILLPPSVGGVIANVASLFSGQVPVNLNYTIAVESFQSSVNQCGITTIITSKTFIEKLGSEFFDSVKCEKLFIEDLITEIESFQYLVKFFACLLLPRKILVKLLIKQKFNIEDLATVIFSSGSTGDPKGVMLSHGNITSNIESLYEVFQIQKTDGLMGVLPFFHSFGFTATLWLPLLAGIKVVYHHNPIDAAIIGENVEKHKLSLLMSTPSFLMSYLRKCSAEQFKTLRNVVTGAEKLSERLAQAFQDKFGIIPMEGYGATELSPVAMLNVSDFQLNEKDKQVGNKLGTVGRPIPGVAVKVINSENNETLNPETEGLLLVKGPNVMLGYLNKAELTAEVIKDGWYITGDIAVIDTEGFVRITDRLSRFSKIGGEMVPHLKIETVIQEILKSNEQICVVTAVPDEKKGEKLIVLLSVDADIKELRKNLMQGEMPNLWLPKEENFFKVEGFPVLGSGKLDLKAIKKMALNLVGQY